MTPDLEALRVLVTIHHAGSFAAAAGQLHKTQSAVSYQIAKLEQQLGCALFDRSGYRAVLTPVGRRMVEEGQRLLHQAESLGHLIEHIAQGWEPQLKLITDGMLPVAPVLGLLKQMVESDIPTRVLLRVEFLSGVQHRFSAEEADMMLTLDYQPLPELTAVPLRPFEAVLVAGAQHPLAAQPNLTLSQLQQHVELSVADSGADDATGGRHTFGSERQFYLSDFNAKYQALLMGSGFGWMPLSQIEQELQDGRLRELDYPAGCRIRYQPHLVFRSLPQAGRAALWLRSSLCEIFG